MKNVLPTFASVVKYNFDFMASARFSSSVTLELTGLEGLTLTCRRGFRRPSGDGMEMQLSGPPFPLFLSSLENGWQPMPPPTFHNTDLAAA